jgi:hypothetical protein
MLKVMKWGGLMGRCGKIGIIVVAAVLKLYVDSPI